MIQVKKSYDPDTIPNSLRLPAPEGKLPKRQNSIRKTTHGRRLAVIEKAAYVDEAGYNDRYKQADVKAALETLYKRKCCFCESHVEFWAVEHYRPKSLYYWLAYSWDNLLYICQTCNGKKAAKFEIHGTRAVYKQGDLEKIHQLATSYAKIERPKLLHSELDDPSGIFVFDTDGGMTSTNPRGSETINTCGLDRMALRHSRFKVLETFRKNLNVALVVGKRQGRDPRKTIRAETGKFKQAAFHDPEESFIAFRRYAAKHLLLKIIRSVFVKNQQG